MSTRNILALFFWLFAALHFTGCERKSAKTEAPSEYRQSANPDLITIRKAFFESIDPQVYELPSAAVSTWRNFSEIKPALLLFANHPLLQPLPGDDLEAIRDLVKRGSDSEIIRRGRFLSADPLFLPPQAVSVSVASGLFSELIFVRPAKVDIDKVALDEFIGSALPAGFLTEEESKGLTLEDGVISGTAWGLPFRCVHPQRIPKLVKPTILHIDLGYFNDLYVNEVKTPIYELMYETAMSIHDAEVPAVAATFSYSNQEVGFTLDSRFIIRELADILANPTLLSGGTPESWTLRGQALYRRTMFNESGAHELISQAAQSGSTDAAAQYALAMSRFETGRADEGFAALDLAVALDYGYALEYLELYERALELNQPDKAIELLYKASTALPDNPFIRLRLADLLLRQGRVKESRPLLEELQHLPWSEVYHPGTADLIGQMQEAAKLDVPLTLQPSSDEVQPPPSVTPPARPFHMGVPGH